MTLLELYPWSTALALSTVAFLFTVIWGRPLIGLAQAVEIGKQIRVDGRAPPGQDGHADDGGMALYPRGGDHHADGEYRQPDGALFLLYWARGRRMGAGMGQRAAR